MNNRRKILVAMGASVLAYAPLLSAQPGKVWRIGFLGAGSAAGYIKETDAIRAGLRGLGYVEGRNAVIEWRWAENDPDRLKELAAELVALKPDAIITHGSATRVLARATSTIPIVIADGGDPVAAGLVTSLARPGGNITGSSGFQTELAGKRVELLKEAVPRIKHVAVLFNSLNPSIAVISKQMEIAAQANKLELHAFMVKAPEEFADAFAAVAKKRVDAVVISEDPLLNSNVGIMAALCATHRLPAIGLTTFAEAGGLLGYSANRPLLYGRSASFIDKILKSARPGDLPIERATKFDLVVNVKTAKALQIKVPPLLLQRADKVVE